MVQVRAAMPGNPSFYENGLQDYSIEALQKLKDKGINTIFVNLAWSRPHIDVVTLEHVAISKSYPLVSSENEVVSNRKKLNKRIGNVHALDMKAMLLVGMPQYYQYDKLPQSYKVLMGATVSTIADASVTCVESPETVKMYTELIADLLENVPGLDGMLVYTYDELAEICDEDSDCPICHGIPQEIRISRFLNTIYDHLQEIKPGFNLWWEPWELSWSQVYGTLEQLNTAITVSCHSTLHEVYFVNHPDIWFRSIASLCKEQGREMIGELFMGGTGEDLGFTAMYPCPRLVYEQISVTSSIPGVTGLKEYYGICPKYMSINEKIMGRCFEGQTDFNQMIEDLACSYTDDISTIIKFWETTSRVLELFPWELSWVMRLYNYHPYDKAYWGQVSFGNLMRTPWNTPSWLSNRRSYYMVSADTVNLTPAYCKDLVKRFQKCIELMDRAAEIAHSIKVKEEVQQEFDTQNESVYLIRLLAVCRLNHLRLSLAMEKLREHGGSTECLCQILSSELENAKALKDLIHSSKIPYMLDESTIDDGIELIQAFRYEIDHSSLDELLETHKYL